MQHVFLRIATIPTVVELVYQRGPGLRHDVAPHLQIGRELAIDNGKRPRCDDPALHLLGMGQLRIHLEHGGVKRAEVEA